MVRLPVFVLAQMELSLCHGAPWEVKLAYRYYVVWRKAASLVTYPVYENMVEVRGEECETFD